ncbi:recombinase family protein [Hathewaya histolytica]|uniref:Phage invertase/recombinase-like protein n=1 Tax=Hathewaya histolytica TaxID=1498 RepID=A0A4U9RBP0_HATHI|nr:recombinase family protein [Hathewaya histolytica]VTQ88358.1 Phage invertase/recombinase-like protein [Hathewaya histolytica]
MKIAIYSRKSKFTGKGESIENQVLMCKEYIERNFHGEKHEFKIYEDEGFSGGNTNRPKFQELLKDIRKRSFDILICYRLDRISRNVADFSSTLELLQNNNVSFISIKEQFDTSTPMGKAMVYIASVFAQLERETIAERVRDNMLELSKSGRWLGGQTPLGFKSKQMTYLDSEYKERTMYKLSPIEDELKLVELIYNKYFEVKSLRKVTQWLLEHKYKTKLGSEWNVSAVSDLLQNPTYVKADEKIFEYLESLQITCVGNPDANHGILTYNKKKGQNTYRDTSEWIAAISKHEGVIESSKWLEIQSTLKNNKAKAPRLGKTHNALLTGLIRCDKCGSPMTVIHGSKDKNGNTRFYYACSMKIDSKGTRCNNQNVRSIDVESAVIKELKKVTKDNGLLVKELSKAREEVASQIDNSNELILLNNSLKTKETSIENLIKQLSQNSSSTAAKYIINEIEKNEYEINEIKEKISVISSKAEKNKNVDINIDFLIKQLQSFSTLIDSTDDVEQKKFLLSCVLDRITWNGDTGNIDVKLWGSHKKK